MEGFERQVMVPVGAALALSLFTVDTCKPHVSNTDYNRTSSSYSAETREEPALPSTRPPEVHPGRPTMTDEEFIREINKHNGHIPCIPDEVMDRFYTVRGMIHTQRGLIREVTQDECLRRLPPEERMLVAELLHRQAEGTLPEKSHKSE